MVAAAPVQTMTVGDIRVTYLPDGEFRLVPTAFFPASDDAGWKLHPEWLDDAGSLICSIGGLLVESGERKILVDTGFGPRHVDFPGFGPIDGGKLLESLAQTVVQPGEIDTVVYTHMHLDHVNASSWRDGDSWVPTFPNARYVIREPEWRHWAGKGDPTGLYAETEEALGDRIDLFDSDQSVAPGVSLVSTPGHTPGHNSVVISSGTERAIILGDVVHCPVQLEEEEWGCVFDVDAALARSTRDKLLAELEGSETVVAGGHFSDFTFGRIMRAEGKRQWVIEKG
jgi:glyoxylase-like metal-dependent hydrolase (beta-lactamase superfamily II)